MKISPVISYPKSSNASYVRNDDFNKSKPAVFSYCNGFPLHKTSEIVSFGLLLSKPNVKLLDCTLRDGGFINNWEFGHDKILDIFRKLDNAKVDITEIGYLFNKTKDNVINIDKTKFPNTEAIKTMFEPIRKKATLVSAMIDYGDCGIENIGLKKDGFVDIIRITFKKNDAENAIKFAKSVKDKGYDIFMQPISVTSYSSKEMLDLVNKVNELKPKGMAIVDTYGLLDKKGLKKYFDLLNKNLNKNIGIGFHPHNNMQLGFSNAMELVNKKTNRKIYLDASLYGMGKSAGNANIELLTMELNRNHGKKYNIDNMLELIDNHILPIRGENQWGYSLNYFISTLNSCHPDYVKFLREKALPVTQINGILKNIEKDKKLRFDAKHIEDLYLKETTKKLNLQV